MKGKKTTYLLIVLVIAIWGAIAYRVFNHVNGGESIETIPFQFTSDSTFTLKESNYTLKLNYSDPFLKGGYVASSTTNQKTVQNKPTSSIRRRVHQTNQKQTKPPIDWPEIVYSGIILNDETGEKLGLIQINESSYLFHSGETRNEIQLVGLYPDSVQVKFKDEQKTIMK